ncbi:hypothetical protein CYMTET_19412 [Cymbomonas tetramitiformis]|uniref:Major facilitator superfamily (MFS) profile domain-containing protein n=1 Tax=Cymbomonas tetramitiformis TaxID=36881 RepID=A0AAE0L5B5_9CHLO|nr:hypothetical protein CYMTET_19412 [Cymbomonas tetramitiformis]|eukprot:gene4697-5751_t
MSKDPSVMQFEESQASQRPWTVYVLTMFACIGGALFGYDTGVISGAMVQIKSKSVGFDLNDQQQEMIVSATTAGAIVGAIISGPGNVRLGRRPMIIFSSLVFTVGSVSMAVAGDYDTLIMGRAVVGLAVGIASHTVPMYIAEAAPASMRGTLVTLNNIFIVLGQVIASLVDCAIGVARVHEGWRYMLGLGTLPAVVMFFGFWLVLPESPRWLAQKGRDEEAEKVLTWLRGKEDPESVSAEMDAINSNVENEKAYPDTSVMDMFRDSGIRRALILGCMLQLLQQFAGINTLMYYSATILAMAGIGSQDSDGDDDPYNNEAVCLSAATAAAQMTGVFVGMAFVDKAGRRSLTLKSLAGVIVALVLLGFAFYGVETSAKQNLAISSMVLYLLVFGVGMSAMPWAVNAEIYPLRCRAKAISIATSVNWVTNYVVAATFLDVSKALSTAQETSEKSKHPDGAFWLYAGISMIGWLWLYWKMPETKGKSLEEIERMFRGSDGSQDESDSADALLTSVD